MRQIIKEETDMDLELNVSYDLKTNRYFITQDTLNQIINNYVKLYKIIELLRKENK